MLDEGDIAPSLGIPDQDGNIISIEDFGSKTIVLYFYPKDDTPGCTLEGIEFTRLKDEFKEADAVILGVSVDDLKSHKKFMEKCGIGITLLSDTQKRIVQDYGVWKQKTMYGKQYMGIERTTFVIKNGKIIKVFPKVNPEGHAMQVLDFIKTL